ncbi:hypothetical protein KY366_08530 [Candidatus Woesearchaeota archaeon]|nr:hypothetical protein [Candidatus Woesearchaeota archaeon]
MAFLIECGKLFKRRGTGLTTRTMMGLSLIGAPIAYEMLNPPSLSAQAVKQAPIKEELEELIRLVEESPDHRWEEYSERYFNEEDKDKNDPFAPKVVVRRDMDNKNYTSVQIKGEEGSCVEYGSDGYNPDNINQSENIVEYKDDGTIKQTTWSNGTAAMKAAEIKLRQAITNFRNRWKKPSKGYHIIVDISKTMDTAYSDVGSSLSQVLSKYAGSGVKVTALAGRDSFPVYEGNDSKAASKNITDFFNRNRVNVNQYTELEALAEEVKENKDLSNVYIVAGHSILSDPGDSFSSDLRKKNVQIIEIQDPQLTHLKYGSNLTTSGNYHPITVNQLSETLNTILK